MTAVAAKDPAEFPVEIKTQFDKVMRTLETFKSEHSADLAKKANREDVVTLEKHEKLLTDIDGLKAALNESVAKWNAAGGGKTAEDKRKLEAKAAINQVADMEFAGFDHWVRKGDEGMLRQSQALAAKAENDFAEFGLKDLSTVVNADGGYMVHPEVESEMIDIILDTSPMRQIARVHEIGTKELEIPVNKRGASAAWITELATRVATLTSEIELIKFGVSEIYALPAVTLSILEDAEFNVEAWLTNEVVTAMNIAENTAFVAGDGVKKPRGFTTVDKVEDDSWTWGKLGYKLTGKSGGFNVSAPGSSVGPTPATNGADCLFDLIYAFKAEMRANLDWTMRKSTLREVRKLKDGDGKYLYKDEMTQSGLVTMLLGYPTMEFEDMPAIGADQYAIALGDFSQGYLITDRIGLQVRRDEASNPGFVVFHFRRRVGGDVRDYQAIKFLKFGTA